ncbi:MAG: 2TM domain-containing protein [Proteobacteria bacterium]|nr:2TM domain-containing protein [Pseudomonadota bacterium]
MTEQDVRKKVKALKRFYTDLMSYVLVNSLLVLVWLAFDRSGTFWPKYVIVVWGFVVMAKAYWMGLLPFFFYKISFLTPDWEDKKVDEMMGKRHHQRKVPLRRDMKK